MEDENGIELSLGLSCGGSSAKSKGKNGSASDARTDGSDKGNKFADNFFNNLPRDSIDADASLRGSWIANINNRSEVEEERSDQHEAGGKRKMLFVEMNHPKKQEKEAHDASSKNPHMGILNSAKISHVSANTEDGSTAENEDVAESDVEGSLSRLDLPIDESTKHFADANILNLQGHKRFSISSENEFKLGNVTYGVPLSGQPLNVMKVPYLLPMKGSNPAGAPGTLGYNLPGLMQLASSSNGERPGTQPASSGNLPLAFGYSSIQLPMLDKEHNWSFSSSPQQFPSSYAGKRASGTTPNPESNNDGLLKNSKGSMQVSPIITSTEAKIYEGKVIELAKGDGKQLAPEEGFASHTEDDAKGNRNAISRAKDGFDQLLAETSSLEGLAIRPGIAANVKFGGSGSFPNLPWVSTTGAGPNGRTISGVPYRFRTNQIKIVCACHGSHMLPEEFVQHASEEHATGTDGGVALPSSNPATSAQS